MREGGLLDALCQELGRFRSLRVGPASRLRRLARVDCIAIVGATCAGKSTLVQAIRDSPACREGSIDVPIRYVTRSPRTNESEGENLHVSPDVFAQKVASGEVGLQWTRVMEANREERYGFRVAAPGTLPVYSGNNALYANAAAVRPPGAVAAALFVGVYAPDPVREARLRARSPDLWARRPGEVAHRLAESSESMLPHVHVVIDNHGPLERIAKGEVIELVSLVERMARPWR